MVSVIIPNFNHASFLQQRIDSVLNQTYSNFEIIILDDCSTDNSRTVIESFRNNPKITAIVYNEINSGAVFKQWKKGIELSKGEYVWIAESDDYADPSFLEQLISIIEPDDSLGFVYSDSFVVKENNQKPYSTFSDYRVESSKSHKWKTAYTNEGRDEIKENLLELCTVNNASAVLFRKAALISSNPFDKEFKYFGDWYCYLKICQNYSLSYLNRPLNYYRDHSVNTSKKIYNDLQYVYEYFILYDWALKNLDFIDKKIIKQKLTHNASHSFFKNWGANKRSLYKKLHRLNPSLFYYLIRNIISSSIIHKFKKTDTASVV